MMRKAIHLAEIICLVVGILLNASNVHATVTLEFGRVFNGSTPPGGPSWLTASFRTSGPNEVLLTLTPHLVSGAYVDVLAFNINPAFVPATIAFTHNQGPAPRTVRQGQNDAQRNVPGFGNANGNGSNWDFVIYWPNAAASRLGSGDVAELILTGPQGANLNEDDFYGYLNGPNGSLLAGIHLAGFNDQSGAASASISHAPEVSTTIAGAMLLLLSVSQVILASKRSRVPNVKKRVP